MSVETMALVLHHSKAKGAAKLVLIGIANHEGDGGAWPSIGTLAKYAGISKRGVQRYIASLVELGEITVGMQRGGPPEMKDSARPNRYEVLVKCPAGCDHTKEHRVTPPSPPDTGVTPPLTRVSPPPLTRVSPEPSKKPSKEEEPSSSEVASDPDDSPTATVLSLCSHLAEKVKVNGHKASVGKLWHRACRLLLDKDGYTEEEVARVIDWATADPFWSANIRSMPTLREKFSTLQAQSHGSRNGYPRLTAAEQKADRQKAENQQRRVDAAILDSAGVTADALRVFREAGGTNHLLAEVLRTGTNPDQVLEKLREGLTAEMALAIVTPRPTIPSILKLTQAGERA